MEGVSKGEYPGKRFAGRVVHCGGLWGDVLVGHQKFSDCGGLGKLSTYQLGLSNQTQSQTSRILSTSLVCQEIASRAFSSAGSFGSAPSRMLSPQLSYTSTTHFCRVHLHFRQDLLALFLVIKISISFFVIFC